MKRVHFTDSVKKVLVVKDSYNKCLDIQIRHVLTLEIVQIYGRKVMKIVAYLETVFVRFASKTARLGLEKHLLI